MSDEKQKKKRIKETGHFKVNTNVRNPDIFDKYNITTMRDFVFIIICFVFCFFAFITLIAAILFRVDRTFFFALSFANFGFGGLFATFTNTTAIRFKKIVRVILALLLMAGLAITVLMYPQVKIRASKKPGEVVINLAEFDDDKYSEKTETRQPGIYYPGEIATVSIAGDPRTSYSISVYYTTDNPSKAKGLTTKTSDSNGIVSWSWQIGSNVKPGVYSVIIEGGGKRFDKTITVTKKP